MSVATDLQSVRNRLNIAIAGRDSYGRVELTQLEREIGNIQADAARDDREVKVVRLALDELADGVDRSVLDLRGLATHARGRVAAQPAKVAA